MSSTITGNATGVVSPNSAAPNLTTPPQATVPGAGDPPASAVIVADVQIALNYITMLQKRLLHQNYGDGSDGAVTFDGTTAYASFASLAGGIYTLTRDVYATTMSVATQVLTNGYAIYAATSFAVTAIGLLDGSGGAGNAGSGGFMPGPHGVCGANGGASAMNAVPYYSFCGLGGAAQYGGAGAVSSNGPPILVTSSGATYRVPPFRMGQIYQQINGTVSAVYPPFASDYIRGGSAGGAGGGDGTNIGGGGGAGGALVVVSSPTITLASGSTVRSTGGHGGNASSGNCGGGSGGGGGAFLFVCNTYTNSGASFVVTGGAGGSKTGTGTAGSAGSAGNATPYVVTIS